MSVSVLRSPQKSTHTQQHFHYRHPHYIAHTTHENLMQKRIALKTQRIAYSRCLYAENLPYNTRTHHQNQPVTKFGDWRGHEKRAGGWWLWAKVGRQKQSRGRETLRLGDRLCLVADGVGGGKREWQGGGFTVLNPSLWFLLIGD